jgi:hypothetical protein
LFCIRSEERDPNEKEKQRECGAFPPSLGARPAVSLADAGTFREKAFIRWNY